MYLSIWFSVNCLVFNLFYFLCFSPLLHFFISHPIYKISNDRLGISPLAVPKLWIADPMVICRSLQRVWEGEEGRKTKRKKDKKERKKKRILADRYFVSVCQ
jgi:hypothetical protein